jgi:acyl carrier protein
MKSEVTSMDQPDERTDMPFSVEQARDGEVYEAPQGEMELAIAQTWKDAFRLERIGRNDNFFELGGNSLLGMDLTEMLANRLAVEVPVVVLFQYPTVRELAEIISTVDGS